MSEPGIEVPLAEVVVPCGDLDAEIAFFVEQLGFRLAMISPAEGPDTAVVSGAGLRLRLTTAPVAYGPPPIIRLPRAAATTTAAAGRRRPGLGRLTSPGGTVVDLIDPDLDLPPPEPRFERSDPVEPEPGSGGDDPFGAGRAGMAYRDLLPARQGGRYIASHIRIAEGGPVPDYVHHHRVRFQMIWCRSGWVRVVYQDQGPPFLLEPGDCVLQPPGIRHRVLESSPGLEVVEISSPARHDTLPDPDTELPTDDRHPARDDGSGRAGGARRYEGQRFVRHVATGAPWIDGGDGSEHRDLGLADATDGMATGAFVRSTGGGAPAIRPSVDDDLCFVFVDRGRARLVVDGGPPPLGGDGLAAGDAVALTTARPITVADWSHDFEALVVRVDGRPRVDPPERV